MPEDAGSIPATSTEFFERSRYAVSVVGGAPVPFPLVSIEDGPSPCDGATDADA